MSANFTSWKGNQIVDSQTRNNTCWFESCHTLNKIVGIGLYYGISVYNCAQGFLVTSSHSCITFSVQILLCLYVNNANHHCASAIYQCCLSSSTLCLCHLYWQAQSVLHWPHSYCKQQDKRNGRIPKCQQIHLLSALFTFITSDHLDQICHYCPLQGSFH